MKIESHQMAVMASRLGRPMAERKMSVGWTDDRVADLRKMWKAGKSAGQIARMLGGNLTRSAVIGKVHRMGMSKDGRADCAAPAPGSTRARRFKAPKVARAAHPRPPKPGPQKKPAVIIGSTFVEGPGSDEARETFRKDGLTIVERVTSGAGVESPNARQFIEAKRGCKWPIGERSAVMVCCNPIERGVYCAGHAAVAYAERPARSVHSPRNEPHVIRNLTRYDRIEEAPPQIGEPAPLVWDEGREAA